MSINTSHHPTSGGVVVFAGEYIILYCPGVHFTVEGGDSPALRGSKDGRLYLTTHRIIFINGKRGDALQSFAAPFSTLRNVDLEQPIFGANYIKGSVKAQPDGGWTGEAKFKLSFKHGGAIDFGKAMLEAARLCSRHQNFDAPPPYETAAGGDFSSAPPAYYEAPPAAGLYGWAPPYQAFPDRPEANTVYTMNAPPPYPGIGGYAAVPPAGPAGANGYNRPPEAGFIDPTTNMAFVPAAPAYDAPPPYAPDDKKKQ